MLELFRAAGVGTLKVLRDATPREWFSLVTLLATVGASGNADADEVARRLRAANFNSDRLVTIMKKFLLYLASGLLLSSVVV